MTHSPWIDLPHSGNVWGWQSDIKHSPDSAGTSDAKVKPLAEKAKRDGAYLAGMNVDSYGPTCVKIPPGVAHGCRALELTHLLYVTSNMYNPEDEGRIAHDDPSIGYDWTAFPEIK